jgi:retinol dehydrogenase-12
LGTNCLGPYLLTQLLEGILVTTAAKEPKYSVRVVFVTTSVHLTTPKEIIEFDKQGTPKILKKSFDNYVQTKLGEQFLVKDVASRLDRSGIMSVGVHPGFIRTDLQRNDSPVPYIFFVSHHFESEE